MTGAHPTPTTLWGKGGGQEKLELSLPMEFVRNHDPHRNSEGEVPQLGIHSSPNQMQTPW